MSAPAFQVPARPYEADAAPTQALAKSDEAPDATISTTDTANHSDNGSGGGLPTIVFIVIAIAVAWIALKQFARSLRRRRLMDKYHDAETVEGIMAGKVWQRMTKEMLLDARGSPIESDQEVFKTKVRQTFKYDRKGKNRYGLRVMIENDVVVGWQQSNQQ